MRAAVRHNRHMTKIYTYPPKSPQSYRLRMFALSALLFVMLLAVPLQVLLAVLTGGLLFVLTAFMLLLLCVPVSVGIFATPPLEVSDEGVRVRPFLGRARLIAWSQVDALKPYPLLPRPDQETERRALVGRARYQPAEGYMLVLREADWQYRLTGYLCGEGLRGVVAFTNRSHADYDALLKRIKARVGR